MSSNMHPCVARMSIIIGTVIVNCSCGPCDYFTIASLSYYYATVLGISRVH
jgi:hypothetical protein